MPPTSNSIANTVKFNTTANYILNNQHIVKLIPLTTEQYYFCKGGICVCAVVLSAVYTGSYYSEGTYCGSNNEILSN